MRFDNKTIERLRGASRSKPLLQRSPPGDEAKEFPKLDWLLHGMRGGFAQRLALSRTPSVLSALKIRVSVF